MGTKQGGSSVTGTGERPWWSRYNNIILLYGEDEQDFSVFKEMFQEDGMYVLEGIANWKFLKKKDKCRKM